MDTNKSNDAEFAQKTNKIKEKGFIAENSSMRQGDKHTLEKLHNAIQTPKLMCNLRIWQLMDKI